MRRVVESETVAVAEASVHLETGDEVLGAKATALSGSFERERTACSDRIAKLPGVTARQVFGGDRVLGDVPSPEGAGEDQFGFEFVRVALAGICIWVGGVGLDIVTFDLFENLVGLVDLLVFDVENGIDEMLVLQRPEPVFETEAGEDGAVVEGGLSVEIELGGPPGGGAVFQFSPVRMEIVSGALGAEGGEVFDLETAGLFEVMVVSDEVRVLLRLASECGAEQEQD